MDDSKGMRSEMMLWEKGKKSIFTHFKFHTVEHIENINNNSY